MADELVIGSALAGRPAIAKASFDRVRGSRHQFVPQPVPQDMPVVGGWASAMIDRTWTVESWTVETFIANSTSQTLELASTRELPIPGH
jgi:hypothetical protein